MGTHLSNIQTKPRVRPPRIVIHGKGKVGKTTFGASAPNVILMPVEEGEGILQVPMLPQPTCYEDLMNQLTELANEEHPFKTLVIDTIDHVEPLIWQRVCNDEKKRDIEQFQYQRGYRKATGYFKTFFDALDFLRRERGMTIIVLCHNEEKTIEDPMIGSYTRTMPKLHKWANALLSEWADVVGYLDIERMARDVGEGNKTTRTASGTGERILYLEDRGAFVAGSRYDLPPQIRIPKDQPYEALRVELYKALGLDKPKTKKEAA